MPRGLCRECEHAREVRSDRGSVFVMCGLARQKPGYPRYPSLPVRACPGFSKADSVNQDLNGEAP